MKLEQVETVTDSERGCGWRKAGGLYLRFDGAMESCGKLPVPLDVCPCCHAGIKPARGWTWFDPRPFLAKKECAFLTEDDEKCNLCPMQCAPERAGLLWVGEKFYKTPADFMSEASRLGISRRIARVPQDYQTGDRVYLAHRKTIKTVQPEKCNCQPMHDLHTEDCGAFQWQAGIFTTFVPSRIEYVCKGTESEKELDDLVKRGLTPVKVRRDTDLPSMEGSKA